MQIQTTLFRIKHFQLNTENNAIRYLLIDVQSFEKLQKKKADFKFKKHYMIKCCMNGAYKIINYILIKLQLCFLTRYLFEFRSDIGK